MDFLPRGAVFFPPAAIQLNLALWPGFGRGNTEPDARNTFAHPPFPAQRCAMTFDVRRLDELPAMWAVLLYRINQSEERDRILRDWEDNVFGGCPPTRTRTWNSGPLGRAGYRPGCDR